MKRVLLIRYKYHFKPQYIHVEDIDYSQVRNLKQGTPCIVETERGEEWVVSVRPSRPAADKEFPDRLNKFVRLATPEDKAKEAMNVDKERSAMTLFKNKVKEKSQDLKIVYIEYTFDTSKIWAYFMAETRADTRDMGKELSEALGVRVEWKQVGARDQAAIIGGMGPCGRELCCTSVLKDYPAVSMRKAKDQNVPMNPNKLNGMCGRLKCCIAYEWGMSAQGCQEHGSCERAYHGPESSHDHPSATSTAK